MKQRVLFLILTVLLGCAVSQVKADPVVTVMHGNATLEANARLVTGAPAAEYSYHAPSNSPGSGTAAVTIGSTHYATYTIPVSEVAGLVVSWYFRNSVYTGVVDNGTMDISMSNGYWEKRTYLEHTENFSYGNYNAVATSTVNDNSPNYGAGPYAGEGRYFLVKWVGP